MSVFLNAFRAIFQSLPLEKVGGASFTRNVKLPQEQFY